MGSGGEIINLNVGGQRFSTSRHTLTAIPVSPPPFMLGLFSILVYEQYRKSPNFDAPFQRNVHKMGWTCTLCPPMSPTQILPRKITSCNKKNLQRKRKYMENEDAYSFLLIL
jgi:hypothetical protein